MTCGIYILQFSSGNTYIGKSVNIEKRISTHKSAIKHNSHYNDLLNNEDYLTLSYKIIEECLEVELSDKEVYWIKLNKPTLNIATATPTSSVGLQGTNHGMSLYTEEQLIQVVKLLALGVSYINISEKTGVHYQTVAAIVSSNKHSWLQEEYPEEFAKAIERKRKKPTYIVKHTNGIEYALDVPKHFCEFHNINYSNFVQMLKGKRHAASNFTLANIGA